MNQVALAFLLLFIVLESCAALKLSRRWSRCDQPGVVSFVFKCIHEDSVRYALKHFKDIPITIMFDLVHLGGGSNARWYQYMSKMNYDIGLFVDYTGRGRFEDDLHDPAFLGDLRGKFRRLFNQDLKFVYAAWTLTAEQTRILEAAGMRSVLASFDFTDTSLSALDIAEHQAVDPAQRSFILVPDVHRPAGNPLVNNLAGIFYEAGFDIVPLSECLGGTLHDAFARDEL